MSVSELFVVSSKILLLDEVTSSLDKSTSNTIKKSLKELSKNKTTLTITHHLDDMEDFDKVIFLKNGKVVVQGEHNNLLKTSKSYSNYING